MSTKDIETLANISKQITVYVGSAIVIAGIIGGLLNICVFLSLRTFRVNSASFYLIVMSFVNVGNLMTGLLSRILISGFHVDWTLISPGYCKLRWYGLQFGVMTSFTCTCLTAIDQYLSTNTRPEWRLWSNIKMAHRLVILSIIIWLLHGIPYLIYFDLVPSSITSELICTSINPIFEQYHTYGYLIVLAGVMPLVTTCIFGLLAINNINHLANRTIPIVQRYLDRQLTKMVLNQLLYNFIFTFPYTFLIILTSSLGGMHGPLIQAQLDFANVMTILLYYLSFTCPFYIYTITSERFRHQLMYVLVDVHLKRLQRPRIMNNQVTPTSN